MAPRLKGTLQSRLRVACISALLGAIFGPHAKVILEAISGSVPAI